MRQSSTLDIRPSGHTLTERAPPRLNAEGSLRDRIALSGEYSL
ncbi:hypothetical protein ASAP_1946 [Asaia bogorensis]|uniref:Uncharacterized protein n=1 Tax=Asaia bogorensis TaxID=91915 RepID=A0A060QKK8_9PROT|nr:hypothetical protein ASAP_1946 [Asaia bogorensis]